MNIFHEVSAMTLPELQAELEAVTARVEARYARQQVMAAGSRREEIDEERLEALHAEIERRRVRQARRGRKAAA